MMNIRGQVYALLLIIIAMVGISCSSTKHVNIEHGSGYNFKAGHPEFRVNAFGYIDEQQGPTLSVSTEIIKGSLIYKQDGDSLSADIAVDFQIIDIDSSENIIANERMERTVRSTDEGIISTRDVLKLDYNLQVDPSNYKIVVTVKDLSSGKNLIQSTESYIPETKKGAYSLSSIQMYGKKIGDKQWNPINTYDVKGKVDSLRFVLQVISPQSNQRMRVNSTLLRFNSDTSHSRPMHYPNFSPSSIKYKGIEYDDQTDLESNQRILTDYSSIFIEYKFANQERGNYRFEVTAQKGQNEQVYKGRSFGVKSKNYPAVLSTRELARPLVYLMDEKDHEQLLSISDKDSLKKEMDRFWLKNVGNASKARSVIEKYYQRVEEANKQFSNFKEGWKTDPGMMYILFGPPWYVDQSLDTMTWSYSYNRSDPERNFYFHQPKLESKFYPFQHFILQRSQSYFSVQYQQVQLWLSGLILQRHI